MAIDPTKVPKLLTPTQIAALGPNYGWHLVRKQNPQYTFGYYTTLSGSVSIVKQQWHLVSPLPPIPSGWTADPLPWSAYARLLTPASSGLITDPTKPPTIYKNDVPPSWYPINLAGLSEVDLSLMNAYATGRIVNLNPNPDNTRPVKVYKTLMPWGDYAYFIPPIWDLNEGFQGLLPDVAVKLGGLELGVPTTINGSKTDSRGYLFAYNPEDLVPVGLPSGAYTPGPNVGKQNIIAVATGVALVGGIVAGGILAGATQAAAGAGAAAGAATESTAISAGAAAASVVDVSAEIASNVGVEAGLVAGETTAAEAASVSLATTLTPAVAEIGSTIGGTAGAIVAPAFTTVGETAASVVSPVLEAAGGGLGGAASAGTNLFSNLSAEIGQIPAQLEKAALGTLITTGLSKILPHNTAKPIARPLSLTDLSVTGGGTPVQSSGISPWWIFAILIAIIVFFIGRRLQG